MAVPGVSTLDNFTRANTTNTLGSNWANSAFLNETAFFQISSNGAIRNVAGINANYWTQQFGGPNVRVEVGITFAAAFNTGGGGRHGVMASITNPGASVNGYEYYADQFGRLNLYIWTAGVATALQTSVTPSFGTLATGDAIVLVVDTTAVEGWAYRTANGWVKVLTSTNLTYTNTKGFIGIRGQFAATTKFGNFIGGQIGKPSTISLLRAGTGGAVTAQSPVAATGLSDHLAKSGQGFLSSFGVNGHWNYWSGSNSYGDVYAYGSQGLQNYRDKVQSLGVQYLRDNEPYDSTGVTHWNDLRAKGIKVVVNAPPKYNKTGVNDYPNNLNTWFASLKPYADIIDAFEGPNEYDLFGLADPDPTAGLIVQQKALWNLVKSDPATASIPVVAPSMGHPTNAAAYAARDAADNPNDRIWNYFDYACWHSYPTTTWPGPSFWSTIRTALDPFYGSTKPVYVTESGYNMTTFFTGNMNAQAASEAIIKMYCEHYLHGVTRSYLYEVVDQNVDRLAGQDTNTHWGQFYTYAWADKASAGYMRNLRSLLSGVAATPGSLKYAFTSSADLGSLLLTMTNGSYRLLVWQRQFNWNFSTKAYVAAADVSATLVFETAKTVVERTTADATASTARGAATSFSLTITSIPVHIFEIS